MRRRLADGEGICDNMKSTGGGVKAGLNVEAKVSWNGDDFGGSSDPGLTDSHAYPLTHVRMKADAEAQRQIAEEMSAVVGLVPRLLSALFYAVASIVIVFVNKTVLTNYKFPSYLFLGVGQMIATVVVLGGAKLLGIIRFPSITLQTPAKVFPLPLIHVINLVCGLGGTKKLNLPMFTVMRRFSILFTMIAEYLVLGTKATSTVRLSVGLMILGAMVAAADDLTFDAVGYGLVLANNVCTAANGVFIKQKLNAKDLGQYGLLYYNSLFMLVPLLIVGYFSGDLEKAYEFADWSNASFLSQFLLSCVCGFILNYSVVLCTHFNSPLTTACVGPIKNLVVTYGGMMLYGDYLFSMTNFLGINLSVLGSIVYTVATFTQPSKKSPSSAEIPTRQNVVSS